MVPEEDPSGTDMRRLTREETAAYHARLREWLPLPEANALLNEIRAVPRFYAVSQGGLKFWREAVVGMACASLARAKRFRLGEDPPDFQLDDGNRIRSFEIANVLPKGRCRDSEYDRQAELWNKERRLLLCHVPQDALQAAADALAHDVECAIKAKLAKGYDPSFVLVLDVSHFTFPGEDEDRAILMGVAPYARAALSGFSEVWLRLGNEILCIRKRNPLHGAMTANSPPVL